MSLFADANDIRFNVHPEIPLPSTNGAEDGEDGDGKRVDATDEKGETEMEQTVVDPLRNFSTYIFKILRETHPDLG